MFHGKIRSGQQVVVMKMDGRIVSTRVQKLLRFAGLGRVETEEVHAGDICALVGLDTVDIGDTIADPESPVALRPVKDASRR